MSALLLHLDFLGAQGIEDAVHDEPHSIVIDLHTALSKPPLASIYVVSVTAIHPERGNVRALSRTWFVKPPAGAGATMGGDAIPLALAALIVSTGAHMGNLRDMTAADLLWCREVARGSVRDPRSHDGGGVQ